MRAEGRRGDLEGSVSKAGRVLGDVEMYLFGGYIRCAWLEDSDINF